MALQNRHFDRFLRYRNFKILTHAKYIGDLKIPPALITPKNPGFVKPFRILLF